MERDVKRGERREGKSDSSRDGVMTRLDNDDDEGNDHEIDEEKCCAMGGDASWRRHGDLSSGWATVQGTQRPSLRPMGALSPFNHVHG